MPVAQQLRWAQRNSPGLRPTWAWEPKNPVIEFSRSPVRPVPRQSFSTVCRVRVFVSRLTMPGRRYTVLIADRSTGVLRRVTISLRTAVIIVTTVLMMPVLDRSRRQMERARRDLAASRDERVPPGRKRQLSPDDRRAHDADSVARRRASMSLVRARRSIPRRRARCRSCRVSSRRAPRAAARSRTPRSPACSRRR